MNKEANKTDVIFRVDTTKKWNGSVFAILPHEVSNFNGEVTVYYHVRQLSSVDYNKAIRTSRLATPKEFKKLKNEMEKCGYNLNIIKKQNYTKFIQSYDELHYINHSYI